MNNTKLMVLLLLTFGQFFIVGLTAFVLWLAGQYGEPPNWRWLRSLRKLRSFGRGWRPVAANNRRQRPSEEYVTLERKRRPRPNEAYLDRSALAASAVPTPDFLRRP